MSDIRERIFGDGRRAPLLRTRKPKSRLTASTAAEDESFAEVTVRREAVRQANHRDSDRHRLHDTRIELLHAGCRQVVTLVNLSGGGAMIEGADGLQLWDEITLVLGECGKVSAAVRWIRGGRIGLEFAQETRLDDDCGELTKIIHQIIRQSHPDLLPELADEPAEEHPSVPDEPAANENPENFGGIDRELRHPLIWSGKIHYDYETIPVRLRNISAGGALIECGSELAIDAELLLELDKAGTFFATVKWIHGDTAGLLFHQPFDLQCLASANAVPAQARWTAPANLLNAGGSAWERQPAHPTTYGQQQQGRASSR